MAFVNSHSTIQIQCLPGSLICWNATGSVAAVQLVDPLTATALRRMLQRRQEARIQQNKNNHFGILIGSRGSTGSAFTSVKGEKRIVVANFGIAAVSAAPAPLPQAPVITPVPVAAAAAPIASEPVGPTINSPMVGTFYRSAAPGEKSFANIGDVVDENSNVCIIEAMKVMNEIKAEARGTIARVLVEDGKPVQYGQPLFELKA